MIMQDVHTPNKQQSSPPGKKRLLARFKISKKILLIIVIVALTASTVYFISQYISTRDELTKAQNPEQAAKIEAEKLAKEIGAYLELPAGETPTIATVNDAEKLNDQVFFEQAQNGDKVLVFTSSRRAVLYRPSTKKIIQYAPVSLNDGQ